MDTGINPYLGKKNEDVFEQMANILKPTMGKTNLFVKQVDRYQYAIPLEVKDDFLADFDGLNDDNVYDFEDKYSKYKSAPIYPKTIQDECHRLIHEAAYHVRTGEIETAQAEIKQIDELLHELLK